MDCTVHIPVSTSSSLARRVRKFLKRLQPDNFRSFAPIVDANILQEESHGGKLIDVGTQFVLTSNLLNPINIALLLSKHLTALSVLLYIRTISCHHLIEMLAAYANVTPAIRLLCWGYHIKRVITGNIPCGDWSSVECDGLSRKRQRKW